MTGKRTVFVTGGAGYVGSHCCKAFSRAGWDVVVYDNLSRGWRDFVRWGPLIEGDILDGDRLTAAMSEARPDVIAHFAALAYVGESVSDPAAYYLNNTSGAINVLRAMRAAGVRSIVFSSSCTTYGLPLALPMDESHSQSPINPYGWSKYFVERILADFDVAYDMRSVVLRYFNAAGADPDVEIGERHEPETHAIPLAIRAAKPGGNAFTIFGQDFDTADGTCIRDYVHVADLASAHLRAIEYLAQGGKSDAFNLGTGTGTSVLEVLAAVEAVSGAPVLRIVGGRRAGDPGNLVAATAKAQRVLGWKPTRSGIAEIVADAWRWHEKDEGK